MLKFGIVPRAVVLSDACFSLDIADPPLTSPLEPFTGGMHVNFPISSADQVYLPSDSVRVIASLIIMIGGSTKARSWLGDRPVKPKNAYA